MLPAVRDALIFALGIAVCCAWHFGWHFEAQEPQSIAILTVVGAILIFPAAYLRHVRSAAGETLERIAFGYQNAVVLAIGLVTGTLQRAWLADGWRQVPGVCLFCAVVIAASFFPYYRYLNKRNMVSK